MLVDPANLIKNMSLARREVVTEVHQLVTAAIATLHEHGVAVLDLKMEDMDGIEVLKVFKKMLPQMPVIMLTGHGSERAAKEGIEYGAFDYLTKPCELEDLIQKIREAVSKGR